MHEQYIFLSSEYRSSMIAALLTFLGFCAALWVWLWERIEGSEYDD